MVRIVTSNTEILRTIGLALYGDAWPYGSIVRDVADVLGVSIRTAERWVAGTPVPDGVLVDLAAECRRRGKMLETLAASLTAHHGSGQSQESAVLRDREEETP